MAKKKLEYILEVNDKGSVKIKEFSRKARKGLKDTGRAVDDLNRKSESSISTWTKLGGVLAGFVGFRVVTHQIADFIRHAGVQEKAVAGMEQAMRSMGRYTPALSQKLKDNAAALQELTTFGDEATMEGTKFLLTYKQIGEEVLPRAQKTMLDLAALMGGDTRQAANMLGKAAMGMTGELRRVGITVDQDTYKTKGFLGVLQQIEDQVGGQAEAMAATSYGGLEQLGDLASDTQEKLGELILLNVKGPVSGWKDAFVALNEVLQDFVDDKTAEQYAESIMRALDLGDQAKEKAWSLGDAIKWIGETWRKAREAQEKAGMSLGFMTGTIYDSNIVLKAQAKEMVKAMEMYERFFGVVVDLGDAADDTAGKLKKTAKAGKAGKDMAKAWLGPQLNAEAQIQAANVLAVQRAKEREDKILKYELWRLGESEDALNDFYETSKDVNQKQKKDSYKTYNFIHDSLKTAFIDLSKRDIQSLSDVWDAVWDSMKTKAINVLADIAAEWIAVKTMMALGIPVPEGAFGAGGGGGGSALSSLGSSVASSAAGKYVAAKLGIGSAGAAAGGAGGTVAGMTMAETTAAEGFYGTGAGGAGAWAGPAALAALWAAGLYGSVSEDYNRVGFEVAAGLNKRGSTAIPSVEWDTNNVSPEAAAAWAEALQPLAGAYSKLAKDTNARLAGKTWAWPENITAGGTTWLYGYDPNDVLGRAWAEYRREKKIMEGIIARPSIASWESMVGFQGGTPKVRETGPALVHQNERIFSESQNEALISAINRIGGGSRGPIRISIKIGTRVLGEALYDGTRNAEITLHSRGITDLSTVGLDI